MNTANLQLEGLYLAVAAMNNLLAEELSLANRDAMAFSIRLLRLANDTVAVGENASFSDLARAVGATKRPYNDQM